MVVEPPPKCPSVAWKLIVAATDPWRGEIYHTRPGRQRQRFGSVETFCGALIAVTGWSLQASSTAAELTARDGRRLPQPAGGDSPHRKFIVAADAPWHGEVYRTRPGLRHVDFSSFEELLRAVLDITGWPLREPVLSRPV